MLKKFCSTVGYYFIRVGFIEVKNVVSFERRIGKIDIVSLL